MTDLLLYAQTGAAMLAIALASLVRAFMLFSDGGAS